MLPTFKNAKALQWMDRFVRFVEIFYKSLICRHLCQRSSTVEPWFCKPAVVGSIPTVGFVKFVGEKSHPYLTKIPPIRIGIDYGSSN